jgi:hypothetical protein
MADWAPLGMAIGEGQGIIVLDREVRGWGAASSTLWLRANEKNGDHRE